MAGGERNFAKNYLALPEYTREFLERLDEEDVEVLKSVLVTYTKATTIGGFFKWLAVALLAVFSSLVAFGEYVRKLHAWFAG